MGTGLSAPSAEENNARPDASAVIVSASAAIAIGLAALLIIGGLAFYAYTIHKRVSALELQITKYGSDLADASKKAAAGAVQVQADALLSSKLDQKIADSKARAEAAPKAVEGFSNDQVDKLILDRYGLDLKPPSDAPPGVATDGPEAGSSGAVPGDGDAKAR